MDDQGIDLMAEMLRGNSPNMDRELHKDGETVLVRLTFEISGSLFHRSTPLFATATARQRLQKEFALRERLLASWAAGPTVLEPSVRSAVHRRPLG